MFFVSILKLVVLFLVAMGIWHLLTRLGSGGQRRPPGPSRSGPFGNPFGPQNSRRNAPPPGAGTMGGGFQPPPRHAEPATTVEAVDLVKCRQCGAYIAAVGARSCGRGDCPQPG